VGKGGRGGRDGGRRWLLLVTFLLKRRKRGRKGGGREVGGRRLLLVTFLRQQ
jgi:hypothetical protein